MGYLLFFLLKQVMKLIINSSGVPTGHFTLCCLPYLSFPGSELLGYCQKSLRDLLSSQHRVPSGTVANNPPFQWREQCTTPTQTKTSR